jgi:hypothetical protein
MRRACCAARSRRHRSSVRRRVCFLEPIALYHERDLHQDGDGIWLTDYPPPSESPADVLLPGDLGVYGGKNKDLCIASYANGLRLSLRVAKKLEQERGLKARVIDLRWLAPLPIDALAPARGGLRQAARRRRVPRERPRASPTPSARYFAERRLEGEGAQRARGGHLRPARALDRLRAGRRAEIEAAIKELVR